MTDTALDLEGTRERVDRLRDAWSADHGVEALEEEGPALLQWLERQRVTLKGLAAGYPDTAIDAVVLTDGIELANQAESAAELFAEAKLVELEEPARGLCVNMTCAVQGHLHHVVGPRMLSFLACLVRQDRVEQSLAVAEAIVVDFGWIGRDWADREDGPGDEDRISLLVLRQALELQSEHQGNPGLRKRIDRIAQVLGRQRARQ